MPISDLAEELDKTGMFRRVFEEAAQGMALFDPEGNVVLVNDHLCRLLGYTREELTGRSYEDLVHPQDLSATRRYTRRIMEGQRSRVEVEKRYLHRDGHPVWVMVKVGLIRDEANRPLYFLSIFQDISQQRLAEEALRASEERYRAIFETAGTAMVIYRDDTTIELCNEEFCRLFGLGKGEIEGHRSWTGFIHPADLPRMKTYHRARRADPASVPRSYEARVIDLQGQSRPVIITVGLVLNSNQTAASVLDITGLKRAEGERALLAAAIEQAAECVILTDAGGLIQYVNPSFERVNGYSRDEVLGNNIRAIGSQEAGLGFPKAMWRDLSEGRVWSGRFKNRKKDGSLFEIETTVSPVRGGDGSVTNFVAVQRDVTHEARLEAELRQAQKMEAIGTLAGGIAHDFNNILASMLGYTEMALHDFLGEGHPAARLLEEVVLAGRRARDLADQILTFSRREERRREALCLASTVRQALRLVRASLPSTIALEQYLDLPDSTVMADPTELHQVILNLSANAGHAMAAKGGVLRVSLKRVEPGPGHPPPHPGLAPGPYLLLTVADTGQGMPPEVLERALEPYFTTKEPGEGTGLGLSLVHGIVKSLGGALTIDSRVGEGTVFNIHLPAAPSPEAKAGEAPGATQTGGGRVLLVDDETKVAAMAAEMLANLGYEVGVRTRPEDAINTLRADPGAWDLLITDQTMPGLSGLELIRLAWEIRPGLPVLLTSGRGRPPDPEGGGIWAFLPKPILRRELAGAVRGLLDLSVNTGERRLA